MGRSGQFAQPRSELIREALALAEEAASQEQPAQPTPPTMGALMRRGEIWVVRLNLYQGAVVIPLDTYNSLMETVHLLRSPANAAHLQRSLEQAERGYPFIHSRFNPSGRC